VTGAVGDYWRVDVEGRPAFVPKTAATKSEGAAPAKLAWVPQWEVSPPTLAIKQPAGLVDSGTIHLSGTATDEHKVTDVFVFVSNRTAKIDRRKVFYRSNKKSANPATQSFEADIPLWPGANVVTVVARENTQVQSQTTLVVDRREPRVAQQTHAQPESPIEPGKNVQSAK
jgi:carboxyl-terminal processing protease